VNYPQLVVERSPIPERRMSETFEEWSARVEEWRQSPDGLAWEAAEPERRREKKAADHLRFLESEAAAMGIPTRYRELVRSHNPRKTEPMEAVSGDVKMLVLSGKTGCGKTAAACWWLFGPTRNAKEDKYGGYQSAPGPKPSFVTSADIATASQFDESRQRGLREASMLVIDDMGIEYSDVKGYFSSIIDTLVNDRYANSRPLIMTTNLSAEAFKLRYGERIADRIREDGRFVSCANDSLRRKS
jgi:hypothetical protein